MVPGGDDGWAVYYRARTMQAAGAQVTMLAIGEHDRPTPAPILDAIDRAARRGDLLGYAPVPGLPALREAVAAWVAARTGVATGPDNVLITAGGQAALFAAHMLALEPGQTGLYLDPFYATYPGTVRAAGGRAVAVPTRADHGFAPEPEAVAAAARATGARSLLINTPNNPTGAVYSRQALDGLARVCLEADLLLISDEVYDGQVWDGAHLSPRALPGMADRVLVAGSMSKSFAMTGSRIGWLVGPEDAIAALIKLMTHTTYGLPGYLQAGALWALTEGGLALEAEVAAPFARRRALLAEALAATPVLRAPPIAGAMYGFVDVRGTGMSGISFAEGLLAQERIAVMPGESFGAGGAGHIRLSLTADDDVLRAALDRLVAFAESQAALA
ncbi:MAG: aminotransferase class I/II-fold pyridoxal phosphate-dependent enzyme [Pseudomonadota bacterium]